MDQGKDNNGAVERAELLIGKTLAGRFRVDAVLGTGAMGVVYRAHHTGLRKDVALKLLRRNLTANEEMVARFDREATAVSRLDHPNCVRVMDFGSTEDGQRFLVMEYLEGEDLAQHAEHMGYAFPPFRVVGLIMQVLAGLEHAHQHGLVHRDIKPENIFVVGTGDHEHIKLLDFGVAKVQHGVGASPLTQAGMVFGTPHYMSPEQARGDSVDARGDLYSLGIVMFALLAGALPFDGPDPIAVLRKQLTEPPPALPDEIPGSLRYFVTRLLAKDPDDRFPDATAAIVALKRAAAPTAPSPAKAQDAKPAPTLQVEPTEESAPTGPAAAPATASATTASPRPTPRWLLPAVGIGSVALLAAIFAGDDADDETSASDKTAVASQTLPAEPSKSEAPGPTADAKPTDTPPTDGTVPTADPTPSAQPDPAETSRRALRANLTSIDALIDAGKHEAARITVAPLLEVYPKEPGLHWRMGQVLRATGPRKNAEAALESYRAALTLDPASLHNEDFANELWPLVDDPSLRTLASKIAVELLGDAGHDRLIAWVNVQKAPLPYAARHAATAHLHANEQSERINAPLQTALDLWQARDAPDRCVAFAEALTAADEHPDSFLAGSLVAVSVPTKDDGEACPEQQTRLEALRSTYATRYAGLTEQVPAAYRKRKPKSSNGRRRRR